MLFSKSEEIKNLVGEHAEAVVECYDRYEEAMKGILGGCSVVEIHSYTNQLRELESKADSIRHKIIRSLLEGGLLVDSRKSLMHVIEGVDVVADITEDIIQEIYMMKLALPEFTHEPIMEMTRITREQLKLLIKSIKNIVSKYKVDKMTKMIQEIEELESNVDDVQHDLIKELFEKDYDLAYKMQVREFINLIGSMADTIEDISDSVEIIMMARKV